MSPISSQSIASIPIAVVANTLHVDENQVLEACQKLDLQPVPDARTHKLLLTQAHLDILRVHFQQQLGDALPTMAYDATSPFPTSAGLMARGAQHNLSKTELSALVDAIGHAKESILDDLSHLLDDKLAGLDDVVIELIRSKSEVDTLRDAVKQLEAERDAALAEVAKYKPAAFGFYKKEK